MPLMRINIKQCVEDSQEYGSTDEHMVSRVFYSIDVDGVSKGDDYSDIKQIVGSAYSSDNMEISPPHEYRGPYDHNTFSNEIAGYFCKCVNSSGAMISLGTANVRMRNNTFVMPYHFQFEVGGRLVDGSALLSVVGANVVPSSPHLPQFSAIFIMTFFPVSLAIARSLWTELVQCNDDSSV